MPAAHGIRPALALSIERCPDPQTEGLSERDAAWPGRLRRIVRAALSCWGRPDLIETAELLLTELVTNALRHGDGQDIGVRVHLEHGLCRIEVGGGAPERPEPCSAAPTDEGGRGLFLVEAMAEAWGIGGDGTTWCTLSLTEGTEEMQPDAVTLPVLRPGSVDL